MTLEIDLYSITFPGQFSEKKETEEGEWKVDYTLDDTEFELRGEKAKLIIKEAQRKQSKSEFGLVDAIHRTLQENLQEGQI